jgi:hypothetical protein
MQKRFVVLAALGWSLAGVAAGCGGGDDSVAPVPSPKDGGSDATASDAKAGDGEASAAEGGPEAGPLGDGGVTDATGPSDAAAPSRLLLTLNGMKGQSELVAFGVQSGQVDGRLVYPGSLGTVTIGPKAPWLLEQSEDLVARLDPAQPWTVAEQWNVALNDRADGGEAYSDPDDVVVGAGNKAYVLRYTRNEIAVIDPSSDGGTATRSIDLSAELQAAGDGTVEMSAGVYVPSKHLVYVLLANINRGNVSSDGFTLLCANTHPTVVAIDVTTDTLVNLNGAAPGSGLALGGYNPGLGPTALAYDAQSDRLIVLENGCNVAADGGSAGVLAGREVEALSLFTGEAEKLLDLDGQGFPSQLVYIDAHRAIVQLGYPSAAYTWDPTTTALGPVIPNAPDSFVWDGVANLLGFSARYDADGGMGYDVLSVRAADGAVTKLGQDPFSLPSGYPGGVALWPSP